jgi:hypothetical protein
MNNFWINTKSVTDVSLAIIEGSLEDFHDTIKALPHKTEISMPGRPKRFIAICISIAAMAMSTFNTIRITQLNEEISTLKEKTDLILDVVHLHEKHLHHVEEKLEQRKSFKQSAISIFKSTSQRRGKTKDNFNFNFNFKISNFKSQFQKFHPQNIIPN